MRAPPPRSGPPARGARASIAGRRLALRAAVAAVGAVVTLAQIAGLPAPTRAAADAPPAALAGFPDFEIVESAPVETTLDHADVRNAHEVWLEMIRGARRSLDFAEFYASSAPGEPLEDVIAAIEGAATRGVRVRFIGDKRFFSVYPETYARLAAREGVAVRRIDFGRIAGGVLHAKYFLVDGEQTFLGSQNFDWRALEHIQELGVRVRDERFTRVLQDLFEQDWGWSRDIGDSAADGAAGGEGARAIDAFAPIPRRYDVPLSVPGIPSDSLAFTPVMSPTGKIPDETLWDEPRLVALIDSAETDVCVQLLTYRPVSGRTYYATLENALRRAAARGVRVRLLVADWCKRASTIPYLKSLTLVPNVSVRMVTIPEWSGGFIPYARVVHAKYLVTDGRAAWIGTSNWESDYFHESRNVGVVVQSGRIGAVLSRFFEDGWGSPYAYDVDPLAEYAAPRIGE